MATDFYDSFQSFQNQLFELADKEFGIETIKGNELFQRTSDAAFDVYKKYSEARVITSNEKDST